MLRTGETERERERQTGEESLEDSSVMVESEDAIEHAEERTGEVPRMGDWKPGRNSCAPGDSCGDSMSGPP